MNNIVAVRKSSDYDGPDIKSLIKKDFKRILLSPGSGISIEFIKKKIPVLRKFERRPDFNHNKCTGCEDCIKVCP